MNDALKELTAKWGGPAAGIVLFLGGLGLLAFALFVPMPEARQTQLFTQGMTALSTGLGILAILAQNTHQIKKIEQAETKIDNAANAATAAVVKAESAVEVAAAVAADTVAAREGSGR